jgi:outer membrane protein assembly factor BamB
MLRKSFTMTLAAAMLGAIASAGANASDGTAMFRGNLAHTGVYPGSGISGVPAVKWKFHAAGRMFASPAIDRGAVFIGSTDGFLYAVDARTGMLRWKFKTGARIVSSAAISAGRVFFGSYDGNFYAVDETKGVLIWKFKIAGERRYAAAHLHGSLPAGETMPDPFDVYMSSPAVWNDRVYFGSGDGNIYALNAADGAVNWTFKTGDVVHASPAIADGMLYIGSWDSYFYALDAATGGEKWRFKTGDDPQIHNQVGIQSSASVVDGIVYFGCRDSHLYALDAHSGKQIWALDTKGSWVIASPAVRSGIIYAATSDSGLFFALDAKTGASVFSLDFKHWPMFSSPAIAGDTAYIGSHNGKLLAIDLSGHAPRWQFETDGYRTHGSDYTSADGTPNYGVAQTENFYDAMVAGADRMMDVGSVLSSPVVYDDEIYFGSADGNLYALTRAHRS